MNEDGDLHSWFNGVGWFLLVLAIFGIGFIVGQMYAKPLPNSEAATQQTR